MSVQVQPIVDAADLDRCFDITSGTFGRQTADAVWMAFNPGWDTPAGRQRGIQRLKERWTGATRDRNGAPNTVFLKAVADGHQIAGFAIWVQLSMVPGHGDAPPPQLPGLEELYPGDEREQRWLAQVDASLHRQRVQVVADIAAADQPAVLVLDMCCVDPAFQRRGIARKLTQWGLDEARRRGGLEALTEGSAMGRLVYTQLGFRQEGGEIVYDVDDEFRGRETPSNVFLRTGGGR